MFKYFTLEELFHSDKAVSMGLDNDPRNTLSVDNSEIIITNITRLVVEVLDPARELLGKPISVSSGYRNDKLNKAVGGANTSQHLLGEAADITCYNNKYLFDIIKQNLIFDQLILEESTINGKKVEWVHVSYRKGKNRKQAFRMQNGVVVK
jgi:hypothetical protein